MRSMKHITVSLGIRRYRVERPWPNPDFDFKGICDVAVLADGRIAAMRRNGPALTLFSSSGELLDQWKIPELVCGHYVSAARNGGVLIADFDGHQILAYDSQGRHEWTLGDPQRPNWMAPFNHPTSAFEDASGQLHVTDGYGNSCLHRFDAQRKLVSTQGTAGKAAGQFTTPHSVIVIRDGRLLVVDRENDRIQIFTPDGDYESEIGDLHKPMALAEMPDGNVLVTDHTPRLSLFSPDGTLLGRCRTLSTVAHGMAAAPDGCIYLAEMTPDTLTRLVPID